MEASDFIALMLGPFLLVVGIGLGTNPGGWRAMAEEFLASRALIFLAGILAFLPGLAIVLTHNLWVPDWRVIITIVGWLGIIGGAFRILFPMQVRAIGTTLLGHEQAMRVGGVAAAFLGLILIYQGIGAWALAA